MKLLIALILMTTPLCAKSYIAEYRAHGYVVIFQGDIKEDDEDEVRSLQTQYIEAFHDPIHPNAAQNARAELTKYGITVKVIQDNPYNDSENATRPYTAPYGPTSNP